MDPTKIRSHTRSTSNFSISFPSLSSSSSSISIQNLSSVLNNHLPSSSSAYWSLWPAASAAGTAPDLSALIPLPSIPFPDIPLSLFNPYLNLVQQPYSLFSQIKNHSLNSNFDDSAGGGGLVTCLREVPFLFFKENFSLEEGKTFRSACSFSPDESENLELQERLTQYLDTVEMHLVREIGLRSESFFEAQGQLEGLNREIVAACQRIGELRERIRVVTGNLVGVARQVQELNAARGNLVALKQMLMVILYVSQAVSALKLD